MMIVGKRLPAYQAVRPWLPSAVFAAALLVIAVAPVPLVPVARAIYAVCQRLPLISLVTRHLPPLFLAFLAVLTVGLLIGGGRAALTGMIATARFNRAVDRHGRRPPNRLAKIGRRLGIHDRLTYLDEPWMAAFCYGFRAPRIAVTAGMLSMLDDTELLAVLAHERAHLARRDPVRYFIIDTLAAAASVLPITAPARHRIEARIELIADQAALAVAPRSALASALLAVLSSPSPNLAVPGMAGLSATESRIAHLTGRVVLPPLPTKAVVITVVLALTLVIVGSTLALSIHNLSTTCVRCTGV